MCGIAGWFDKTNNLNKHQHIIDNMSLSLAIVALMKTESLCEKIFVLLIDDLAS